MKCRHCGSEIKNLFVDLGSSPPSNSYLSNKYLNLPEKWYPLRVLCCNNCWLVQTEDFVAEDEMFSSEYAYFSSFSSSFLTHVEKYVSKMVDRFGLDKTSNVVEVASNDGYLLQYFVEKDIPCLGVEPTLSTAATAREKGIEVVTEFFAEKIALEFVSQGKSADLIVANNVLAHVPDINDFVKGFSVLLNPKGVATFEFPHLVNLVENNQFDTVYHEHYSYLSLTSVNAIFESNNLSIFDVDELPTHGGSLRVYAQRSDSGEQPVGANVGDLLVREEEIGLKTVDYYAGFQKKAEEIKLSLLEFLIAAKREGKQVVGYGAAAKGNTMINYAGVGSDLISYVVDKNPAKQNMFLPGSRIPIKSVEYLKENRPDYIIILPWNLSKEIKGELIDLTSLGTILVRFIPEFGVVT
jgi:SAM-dependent methyltransferase